MDADSPLSSAAPEGDTMAKTMTASQMTDGQIENAVRQLRDAMVKHRDEIDTEAAQQTLGVDNLGMRMFTVFRELAEAASKMIVRNVSVNHSLKPQQVLDATDRRQYTDPKVVETMPCRGLLDDHRVYFFKPEPSEYDRDGYMSDEGVEKALDRRGLKAADAYSVVQVNIEDPAFADEHPNATHWQDANGKWCFVAFHRWYVERYVSVDRDVSDWDDNWWFAGVRKPR